MPRLYVVATPIGNLNDMTPRMREALEAADLIAAEDTRVTGKLLNHLGLSKPTVSCHRHNEDTRAETIISRMIDEDLTVALTCDAGTPAISDPGQALVAAAWEAGIEVTPICGPSATVTALSAAGFDAREFAFYGFLPREKKALGEKLASIRRTGIPVAVIYESPHRIVKLIEAICETLPGSKVCVCSDLSKYYEKLYRGACGDVLARLKENPNVEKGEYSVVLDLSEVPDVEKETEVSVSAISYMINELCEGLSLDEAARRARERGYARNEIYKAKLRIARLMGQDD